jgi:hypothetical protein
MKWQKFAVIPKMGVTLLRPIGFVSQASKTANAIMIARGGYGAIAGEKP